ncbi:MAG: sigma-70 family RNA polymerase sigma factor [Candidatus Jacksonbacteria bacterium]|nr:sigma-70 family RNA polymerase sigma factor [Candidatus Jacksonbacteria bacterium]
MKSHAEWEKKFTDAYNAYSDALFRFCFFRVFDREKAKEFVQDTFTRGWDYVRRGNNIKNIRAFLYTTARNIIIDEARKRNRMKTEPIENYENVLCENPKQTLNAEIEIACDELKKLDEPYREAVTMRFIDGFSPKEIAAFLGETENVVSVRIHRGVAKLRALLHRTFTP